MGNGLIAAVDRRLEALIVAWVRRQWPVLRLVPAGWIRPAITPTAVRLRRSLSRTVLALTVPSAIILALVTVVR